MARRNQAGATAGGRNVTTARLGGKQGPQLVEGSWLRWNEAHEARFLDELCRSCNVKRAAAASGFSTEAIYARRRRDAGFAGRWAEALGQGYLNIELALLARATETLEGGVPDPTLPVEQMTIKEALSLLKLHQASVKGEGHLRGRRPRPRSLDEMRSTILSKLEAIEAKRCASGDAGSGVRRGEGGHSSESIHGRGDGGGHLPSGDAPKTDA